MALTLLKWTIVQVISLIQRHHCLRHRPFDHRFIGFIDIDARGHMPRYPVSAVLGTYMYLPNSKQVRDT